MLSSLHEPTWQENRMSDIGRDNKRKLDTMIQEKPVTPLQVIVLNIEVHLRHTTTIYMYKGIKKLLL